ncbi:hypothetical protein FCV25MIE_19134, partial [Fagus crenata]
MAGVRSEARGRSEAGHKRSFRIEAKRFDIELEVRGPSQGKRGEKSYVDTVIEGGVRQPAKSVEKHAQKEEKHAEQAEVLTAVTSDVKGKQSNGERSDKIPQIVPPIKKRSLLRFFPNVATRHDYRDCGKGLTITLKDNGQRVVSRNNSAQDSNKGGVHMGIRQDKKLGGGPNNKSCKWVPRQVETRPGQANGLTGISLVKQTALKSELKYPVGSRNRPTFEVGESSDKGSIGLEDSYCPAQVLSEAKLRPPTTLDSSSDTAIETSTCEKIPGSFKSSSRQLLGRKWVLQLRDEGRLEIVGLETSPWDFVRSNHDGGLGRWPSGILELRATFPTVIEEDRGVSCGENRERSVMVVEDCSDALVLEPLAVDFSMAEQ